MGWPGIMSGYHCQRYRRHRRGPVRHPHGRPELLRQVKWRELIDAVSSCGARQPAVSHSVPTSRSTTAPTVTPTSDVLITPGPESRERRTVPTPVHPTIHQFPELAT